MVGFFVFLFVKFFVVVVVGFCGIVRVQGGRGEGSKWQAAGIVAENSYLDPPQQEAECT